MSTPSEQYIQWTKEHALPFWIDQAWDPKLGGWFERLDSQGKPQADAPRRTRVQARQVIALCQALHLGWGDASYRDLALQSIEWWWDKSWGKGGLPGFGHQLDARCEMADGKRDAYDHAFAILALTWAYKSTRDSQLLSMLGAVLDFMAEHMAHPNGGVFEDVKPNSLGAGRVGLLPTRCHRRQNPHMHLFEAAVALYSVMEDTTGQDSSVAKGWAASCLSLFDAHFYDAKNGQIIEHFDGDWRRRDDDVSARRVEPGHGAEWVWLLHDAKRTGLATALEWPEYDPEKLNDTAMAQGFDDQTGLMINWYDPITKTRSTAARSWPTMEMVRAGVAMGDEEQVERGCEGLIRYLNLPQDQGGEGGSSLYGGWRDSVDVKGGNPDAETLAGGGDSMQTSTLYHVMGVVLALSLREGSNAH